MFLGKGNHPLLSSLSLALTVALNMALTLFLSAPPSHARPLTEDDIRNAKKIGLMPGTFDPVTDGHMLAATAAAEKGVVDFVILAPQENPHKQPIARTERLKMISLAASDSPKVLYADQGSPLFDLFATKNIYSIAHKIREINPGIELHMVAGTDFASNPLTTDVFEIFVRPKEWDVISRDGATEQNLSPVVKHMDHVFVTTQPLDVSSSGVKKYLQSHLDLYQVDGSTKVPGLNPKTSQYILQNSLYEKPPYSRDGSELLSVFSMPFGNLDTLQDLAT